jgi:hypothetical protein
VKAIDEFKAERNQQGDEEQQEGRIARDLCAAGVNVSVDAVCHVQESGRDDSPEDNRCQRVERAGKIWALSCGRFNRTR